LAGDVQQLDALRDQWRVLEDEPVWAEIQRYCARAGLLVEPDDRWGEPWLLGAQGDWAGAAEAWARLGDTYEQASELADSGESETMLEAVRLLDALGARPAADLVRRRLRRMGLRVVPRGPSAATRANPVGLTSRQSDVLDLLVDGLTNAEIAEKLVLSVRTVDHHVSAILTRLGVSSRREVGAALRTRSAVA
jgi:DNA-binding CsgD family transcriptional regulator